MPALRSSLSLGVFALLNACAAPVGPDSAAPEIDGASQGGATEPADGWWGQVSPRLRAGERDFGVVDGGFVAVNRAWGMRARIDRAGTALSGPQADIGLRFDAWGRESAMEPALDAAPRRGACLDEEDAGGACLRRIELERGPVIEWWANTTSGLQQGWELAERPEGQGPLVLEVEVSGAQLEDGQDGDVLWLTDEGGGLWSYAGLLAWDADGDPLPARMFADGDRIRIEVDDRGATWPLLVDPVASTAGVTWSGEDTDNLGLAVAGRGDLNDDGYGDVAIGVPGYSSGTGAVYVYYGSASGPATTADVTLAGGDSLGAFGSAVAMDGDVNGDGFDDVVVGAPSATLSASEDGAVYVFLGSSGGLSDTVASTLTGSASESAYFGASVNIVGDVNGDGYDDVAVGEYGYSTETGRAWVFAGSASGPSASTWQRFTGAGTNQRFGYSVSGGGDVNGDGLADVSFGIPHYESGTTTTNNGRVVNYHGVSTFFTSTPSLARAYTFSGSGTSGYEYGTSVSLEMSLDDDIYADLAVGAPYGASTRKGRVYLYYSTGTALPTGASENFDGPTAYGGFGTVVAQIGDLDSDGFNDLAVGAPYEDSNSGSVIVYKGEDPEITEDSDVNTISGSAGAYFGAAVAGAGDVNGDGYFDLLIGAPEADSAAGQATLHYGGADADEDGYLVNGTGVDQDCDDDNDGVNPGASEVCDDALTDEDCDGLSDDDDSSVTGTTTWYLDADEDGYGDPGVSMAACLAPAGYVAVGDDCDDTNADINPEATELCDDADADEDCDGLSDNDDDSATGGSTWYEDADGDTYGDAASATVACDVPDGYVANDEDCDDGSDAILPGGIEVCDSADADEDCDGLADDADGSVSTSSLSTWYADADADTYGDPGATTAACDLPEGYVANDDDCDDESSAIRPGGTEVCDTSDTDEDCDGLADDADDSASGERTWYADADGDEYGDASSTTSACDLPDGYASNDDDCDDSRADVSPDATELCDEADTDEDCDGSADDADSSVSTASMSDWYADADADTYGDPSATTAACDLPEGFVANDDDCDDGSASIRPGGTEVCDAADADEDCDGSADDADSSVSTTSLSTWYADTDADTYGDPSATTAACDLPEGFVANDEDCDDSRADVSPDATEVCDDDDTDEDCDGSADDADASVSTTSLSTWYADTDTDTYGDPSATTAACDLPEGFVDNDEDCDDGRADINPDGAEVCDDDNADEDCDGLSEDADDSATGQTTWYADADSDTYGDADATAEACDLPDGYVTNTEDCDDSRADINPAGAEVCDDDNADEDCDGLSDDDDTSATGQTTWYADADADGYGDPTSITDACDLPEGFSDNTEDCDDTSDLFHPGAEESDCEDPNDYNCDGSVGYADADEDGYAACEECDDTVADINPGADELVGDGTDQDCDGVELCYVDADEDGYRDDDGTTSASEDADCDDATEADESTPTGDCDDGSVAINPAAEEVCDGLDNDCDLSTDEDLGTSTWYADADGDGYGDGRDSTESCAQPDGTVANANDCDDTDADISPDATEVEDDGIDQDCNGFDAVSQGDDTGEADTGEGGKDGGCGCGTAPRGGTAGLLVLAAGLALGRRRRR